MKGGDMFSSDTPNRLSAANSTKKPVEDKQYKVSKLKGSLKINGDWNKVQWKNIETIKIENYFEYYLLY